jgi:cytochrome c biogenesis factor
MTRKKSANLVVIGIDLVKRDRVAVARIVFLFMFVIVVVVVVIVLIMVVMRRRSRRRRARAARRGVLNGGKRAQHCIVQTVKVLRYRCCLVARQQSPEHARVAVARRVVARLVRADQVAHCHARHARQRRQHAQTHSSLSPSVDEKKKRKKKKKKEEAKGSLKLCSRPMRSVLAETQTHMHSDAQW